MKMADIQHSLRAMQPGEVRLIEMPDGKPQAARYAGRRIGILATFRKVGWNRWKLYHLGSLPETHPGPAIRERMEALELLNS